MSDETKYTSDMNFGNPQFSAGSVFTRDQWKQKGGSDSGLDAHLAKGYIREWEGQGAPAVPPTVTQDSAESVTLDQPSEDSSLDEEESEEEVVVDEEEEDSKAQGVWNFRAEDLEPLELDALNALYKDHASKFGLNVRAFLDKDRLIEKMCSEA